MLIREATAADWPQIWPFLHTIVAAGDTFTWDRDITEADARAMWMKEAPGRTFVAVDEDGTVLGTAETHRNQMGGGSHVANAGFMVDPRHTGRGVARALCARVLEQARTDGYRSMQFNAVVETNHRAVALWQSLGFEVLTTVPEAFQHPDKGYVGLLVMYRRL
ncbi:GNAT family N-acetyltransferase [Kitasatospora herbaricolor]|uniref:GNAT family N-acetyltransferase n=1 Tax=Kitasatospora herbaricolor TaxID=68217 RepID=UPI0036D86881